MTDSYARTIRPCSHNFPLRARNYDMKDRYARTWLDLLAQETKDARYSWVLPAARVAC
jgi:hypothetical protein